MTLCDRPRLVIMGRMKPPLFVRPLTDPERPALRDGLRSPDAFTLRRCQILLASDDGLRPAQIAARLGCASQTVRNAIRAFDAAGVACLREGSHRPKSVRPEFDDAGCERLRALLHRSPRDFGKPTSLWTLALAAEVAFAEGITAPARQRRDDPPGADAARRRLEAGQDLDHQPRPGVPAKKGRATG